MQQCGECGAKFQSVTAVNKEFFALGGVLQNEKSKKACSTCRAKIRGWIEIEVFPFNLLLHQPVNFQEFFCTIHLILFTFPVNLGI